MDINKKISEYSNYNMIFEVLCGYVGLEFEYTSTKVPKIQPYSWTFVGLYSRLFFGYVRLDFEYTSTTVPSIQPFVYVGISSFLDMNDQIGDQTNYNMIHDLFCGLESDTSSLLWISIVT